jgi:hypothetical protein
LISLPASGNATGSGDQIDLYLPLPDFDKFVIEGVDNFKTDIEGFQGVLKLYETYMALGDLHLDLNTEIETLDDQVASLEASVKQCTQAKDASEEDRQFIYKLRASDQKKAEAAAKRQKMRAILFGAGGGVVALAAGLLIGVFAF